MYSFSEWYGKVCFTFCFFNHCKVGISTAWAVTAADQVHREFNIVVGGFRGGQCQFQPRSSSGTGFSLEAGRKFSVRYFSSTSFR